MPQGRTASRGCHTVIQHRIELFSFARPATGTIPAGMVNIQFSFALARCGLLLESGKGLERVF